MKLPHIVTFAAVQLRLDRPHPALARFRVPMKTKGMKTFAQDAEPARSSDRSFGLVFAAFFLIVGLWPLLRGSAPRLWSLAAAAIFLVLALARPKTLALLNRVWTSVGLLLHRVINPLAMAIVFYATVTPIGLLLRLLGKDPLRLGLDRDAETYWIERRPPGPAPETMSNQF